MRGNVLAVAGLAMAFASVASANGEEAVERVVRDAYVNGVHVDRDVATRAWTLLKDRPDKHWSLVDCASFVVMQRRGLRQALSSDRHFEQAGFGRLLTS